MTTTRRLICIGLAAAVILTACQRNTLYDQYGHTSATGWDKNDTLTFHVPRLTDGGLFSRELRLRINSSYPFRALTLVVEQTVFPDHTVRTDTVNCPLSNADGSRPVRGVGFYQYAFPIPPVRLEKGDSLKINIHHYMKRDILPGITDIGIHISR